MICCEIGIYIKTKQYARSLRMPLSREGELRAQLTDLTGEVFLPLPHKFCPFCGKELEREDNA